MNAVTAERQTITVHVWNSTGQDGLGASAASGLQQHGFKVLTPDDYPSVLGQDFNTVNAPPPTGSPAQVHLTHNGSIPPTDLPRDLSVTNAADVSCEYAHPHVGIGKFGIGAFTASSLAARDLD